MAKERLQHISLHHEMQRSYLEYAMSVIVGRALPDARDGLKPVQRRILFAMHELGLTPDRPFRKCARVVGDVLGKYHPHGDQAVYDALVRLVQDFASRYPVLDGHGNFGSIDDDPAAAMRYTETRLAKISNEALLGEIGANTVDFNPNFDGSQQEPNVLPAQLPFLILNGSSGIAVGMATNIPPHNINEVIDALVSLIRNPELSDEKLFKIIPGPDFPTGGELLLGNGIKETYTKGKGSIPIRGISHIEEINPGKGKHRKKAIVITELPYQVSKSSWIEKLADQVNNDKFEGIADIRDESDRDGMRITIELRRDTSPEKIQDLLYKKTSLQTNFGATLLAIVNGQPKQLALKSFLNLFLEYRELTIKRRTDNELFKTNQRLEIVEGLIKALKDVRAVIEIIESAKDVIEAKAKLMDSLYINEKQTDGILSMPLRKLTSLEKEGLRNELEELKKKKNDLLVILENRQELLNTIISEFKLLKKQFGSKRKTKLIEGGDELLAERNAILRPNAELQRKQAYESLPEDGKLIIQADQQIKVLAKKVLDKIKVTESCALGNEPPPLKLIWPINSYPKILVISNHGKVAFLRWEFAGNQPGGIKSFLPTGFENEEIISILPIPDKKELSLGLLTSEGKFKRICINDILEMSGRAATILKLKKEELLISASLCKNDSYLLITSDFGRILKLKITEDSLPIMGKLAQGSIIMKLFPGESLIGSICIPPEIKEDLILTTSNGSLIKYSINDIRLCYRGSLGSIGVKLKDSKNSITRVIKISLSKQLIGIVTSKGKNGRLNEEDIKTIEYRKEHKKLLTLSDDETVEDVIPLIDPDTSYFFN